MVEQQQHALEAALEYARRGWLTGPVWAMVDGRCACGDPNCASKSAGKHPLAGFHAAASDEASIRRQFKRPRVGGVYLRTGSGSGITVLDIDPRHGGDETLARLEAELGPLPPTLTAQTGGGGRHFLFRYTPGLKSKADLEAGLDIRNDGGCIIAAPSPHLSGGVYQWVDLDAPIAEMPAAWVAHLLRRQAVPHQQGRAAGAAAATSRAGHGAIPEGCISEGGRNDTLFRLACRWRGREGASRDQLQDRLRQTNRERCSPPLDDAEVDGIASRVAQRYPAGVAGDAAALERLRALRSLVVAMTWTHRTGATDREALICLCNFAEGLGRDVLGLSWRKLGEIANLGDKSAKRVFAALRAAGWLQLAKMGSGPKASEYRLSAPVGLPEKGPTRPDREEEGSSGSLLRQADHDTFRWGAGCGKNARPLLAVLDEIPRSLAELARRSGIKPDTVGYLLKGKLTAAGLVKSLPGEGNRQLWVRGDAGLDDAAKTLRRPSGRPVWGARLELVARHAMEREVWRRERLLYAAIRTQAAATPSERRALLYLVRRHAGYADTEAAAAAHAAQLLARHRAEQRMLAEETPRYSGYPAGRLTAAAA